MRDLVKYPLKRGMPFKKGALWQLCPPPKMDFSHHLKASPRKITLYKILPKTGLDRTHPTFSDKLLNQTLHTRNLLLHPTQEIATYQITETKLRRLRAPAYREPPACSSSARAAPSPSPPPAPCWWTAPPPPPPPPPPPLPPPLEPLYQLI